MGLAPQARKLSFQAGLVLLLVGCEQDGIVLGLAQTVSGETSQTSDATTEPTDGAAQPSEDSGEPMEASFFAQYDGSETNDGAPPSCSAGTAGTTTCGVTGESCCASVDVASGTFDRAYTNAGNGPTGLANPATLSEFRLDKYDVTVGRFRVFVGAWTAGFTPPAGSGKHTHLNGGKGLANVVAAGTFEPGWAAADDANVAPTTTNLDCDPADATWTEAPAGNEGLPITCANWYEAYAFCIWDDSFLPSESEWEYAAAGGSQQREYPWGNAAPGTANQYAIYGCYYPNGSGACEETPVNIAPVGTAPLGAGLWGQLDLTGEVYQWTLDTYADYVDPCKDCASLSATLPDRVRRGGAFGYDETVLTPSLRSHIAPAHRDGNFGFRCARTP
jgi:formylglycine-generating enzyme required for sulfatase activity